MEIAYSMVSDNDNTILTTYLKLLKLTAYLDQFKQHGGGEDIPDTHQGLRKLLCDSFLDLEELHEVILNEAKTTETKEEYYNRMIKNGEYGDHIMLRTAATIFQRNIIVFPIFPNPYWQIKMEPCHPVEAIFPDFTLLHYDDTNFEVPHYRSIIYNPNKDAQDPPSNSTVVASPTTNPKSIQKPDCSPVLPQQSRHTNLEDTYDRMCGGIQAPIRHAEPVVNFSDIVEVASGTNTHGK